MGDGDVGLVPVALATRVQGPALVLCGDEGLGRKVDVNRKLAGALPNARLRVLEATGTSSIPRSSLRSLPSSSPWRQAR
jgi:hypothetical protein